VAQEAGASRDVVIFVHGFNTDQSEMLARMAKIEAGLKGQGYPGAVIGFDWPSDGAVLAYGRDRADAKRVARYLVLDGIALLLAVRPRLNLHLLAHSMGAYVILRGFSDIGDNVAGAGTWKLGQAVWCSADVYRDWMADGAWGRLVMDRRVTRLTNFYSRADEVLNLSGTFLNFGRRRAGRDGLPNAIPSSLVDVYSTAQYQDKVDLTGVSDFEQTLLSHAWWFDDEGFYRDVALTLAGRVASNMPTRRPTTIADMALLT
jgi:esterase/lipase superfamily enzyme